MSDTRPSDPDADVAFILRVAVPVPLLQVFDYLPPPNRAAMPPAVGCRVAVPFGRSRRVVDVPDLRTRGLSDGPFGSGDLDFIYCNVLPGLNRGRAAVHYQHPLGEVLQAALPTGLRRAREAADAGERALILSGVSAAPPRAGSRAAQLLTCSRAGR